MGNLKLTNLERMSQTEMKNVKGGRKWFIKIGRKDKTDDSCLCHGYCTASSERASQENHLKNNQSHE